MAARPADVTRVAEQRSRHRLAQLIRFAFGQLGRHAVLWMEVSDEEACSTRLRPDVFLGEFVR